MDTEITQIYYAHSAENKPYEYWQTMRSHTRNVGETAAGFAAFFWRAGNGALYGPAARFGQIHVVAAR